MSHSCPAHPIPCPLLFPTTLLHPHEHCTRTTCDVIRTRVAAGAGRLTGAESVVPGSSSSKAGAAPMWRSRHAVASDGHAHTCGPVRSEPCAWKQCRCVCTHAQGDHRGTRGPSAPRCARVPRHVAAWQGSVRTVCAYTPNIKNVNRQAGRNMLLAPGTPAVGCDGLVYKYTGLCECGRAHRGRERLAGVQLAEGGRGPSVPLSRSDVCAHTCTAARSETCAGHPPLRVCRHICGGHCCDPLRLHAPLLMRLVCRSPRRACGVRTANKSKV